MASSLQPQCSFFACYRATGCVPDTSANGVRVGFEARAKPQIFAPFISIIYCQALELRVIKENLQERNFLLYIIHTLRYTLARTHSLAIPDTLCSQAWANIAQPALHYAPLIQHSWYRYLPLLIFFYMWKHQGVTLVLFCICTQQQFVCVVWFKAQWILLAHIVKDVTKSSDWG